MALFIGEQFGRAGRDRRRPATVLSRRRSDTVAPARRCSQRPAPQQPPPLCAGRAPREELEMPNKPGTSWRKRRAASSKQQAAEAPHRGAEEAQGNDGHKRRQLRWEGGPAAAIYEGQGAGWHAKS